MLRFFHLALHWQILIAMVCGAAIGMLLNLSAGDHQIEFVDAGRNYTVHDTPNRVTIDVADQPDAQPQRYVIDATGNVEGAYTTLDDLAAAQPEIYAAFYRHGRSTARWLGDASQAVGGLFLRLLKMVAIPLIITSLITGVTGLQSAGRFGSMFGRTLLYYIGTSTLAILAGLLMVNLIRPGLREGVVPQAVHRSGGSADLGTILFQQLEAMIPENPFAALAEANFLSIIAFSLGFGIFVIYVGGEAAQLIRRLFEAMFEVMMAWTMGIIHLAPVGVFFLILSATATQGGDVFRSLAWYMLAVICALAIHAMITLPVILHFIARRKPWEYARALSPALLTAFSSASSNATLPLTLANVEQRGGVPNRVSSFVLPLGATVNMDGTALYEAVAVLFIAQLTYGVNLPLADQLIVVVTALLASIGAAGIPHAGLVMMVIILQAVDLPTEKQGIIIAVDRVLDMCRTSVNVWSDSCGAAVIARFDPEGDAPDAA